MRLALLTALLAFVVMAAPARAAAPVAVVPYFLTPEGAIAINVTIDGRGPYAFIVDTGATLTLVFENFAKAASLVRADGPSLRILSISGSKLFEPYRIGDLFAGTRLAGDHVGVVLPDWEAPRVTPAGILGLDVFENFALAFDVGARTIAFYPAGALPEDLTRRMRKIPMKLTRFGLTSAALYTVRGRVNGEPINFILDLGIPTTLVNYAAGDALFANQINSGGGRAGTSGSRLLDVFDDRTRLSAGVMRRISIGTQRWQRRTVWIYDAPLFDELGVQRLPYGLLGADMLTDQDFAIDFAAQRLYFGR